MRFNLSGEIPQVAATKYLNGWKFLDPFQSLRRDSSSGRLCARSLLAYNLIVSISQARFLKWPQCCRNRPRRWSDRFNLSGEIPQVAAQRPARRPADAPVCFNLSGEIPQVAA